MKNQRDFYEKDEKELRIVKCSCDYHFGKKFIKNLRHNENCETKKNKTEIIK